MRPRLTSSERWWDDAGAARRRPRSRVAPWLVSLALVACSSSAADPPRAGNNPDPERGRALIALTGCGACHVIPGVDGAAGAVGPSLAGIAMRHLIAGDLPNTPDQLAAWIRVPQTIKPGDAMPDLGLNPRDAADIAAYLGTLH